MAAKGTLSVHAYLGSPPPSTVTSDGRIRTTIQRMNFFAKGLHWVFYFSNMAIWYKVSSDGVAWSLPVQVTVTSYPDFFSLYFDGLYIHYACNSYSAMWYRKGMVNADGTIGWLTEEQHVPELEGYYTCDPTICVDSYGYPWIGYYDSKGVGFNDWLPAVVKSRRNDGIWETDSGFPYFPDTTGKRRWYGISVIPLSSGKVYALYYRSWQKVSMPDVPTQPIYGKLWDGVAWGNEEQASLSNVANEVFHMLSVTENADEIHVTFLKDLTHDIVYVKRATVGWEPERVIKSGATGLSIPVVSCNPALKNLVALWFEGNQLYYAIAYINEIWSEPAGWLIEQEPVEATEIICSRKESYILGTVWRLTSGALRYAYRFYK